MAAQKPADPGNTHAPLVRPGQYPDFYASYGNPIKAAMISPIAGVVTTLANMISPTVRQHAPLTAIDNTPHPALAAAFGDLLRAGRQMFHDSDVRTYGKAVLDRQQQPITEKDFTPKELQQLQFAATRRPNQNTIQFKDYTPTPEQITKGELSKTGNWRTTIGRANIVHDPAGGVHIKDTYDFNRYADEGAAVGNPIELLSPPTWYGRRALPAGLRGTPIDIKLPVGWPKGAATR